MGTWPSWPCPPLPSGQHRQWLLTGAGVPRGGQTPPRRPASVATEEPLPTPHRGGDLAFMALSSPLGGGVLALMAKASSSMGDRRVDRPVACGVLTVPWRVTCGVFLLSFFLFNTLLFQEFQRRRRVGCLKVLKNLKALKRHG